LPFHLLLHLSLHIHLHSQRQPAHELVATELELAATRPPKDPLKKTKEEEEEEEEEVVVVVVVVVKDVGRSWKALRSCLARSRTHSRTRFQATTVLLGPTWSFRCSVFGRHLFFLPFQSALPIIYI
jgi:hypothetical protein